MAEIPLTGPWRLIIPETLYTRLIEHHFPGDGDEHGSVIMAGIAQTKDGVRLLAREFHPAVDGHDYVPGQRGYRMLTAVFVRDHILACRDEELIYLAVHNHGGIERVAFSDDDLASHERGYPALLDIVRGRPVGALVLAQRAIAGDIWLPDGRRVTIADTIVVGRRRQRLTPMPELRLLHRDASYDRQARLFGDAGQEILRSAKVGIIGVGGVGALIAEYLGHLGVGHFVLIDPQRIAISNLSRVVGATRLDALAWFAVLPWPRWARRLAERFARRKVDIARRVIRRAQPRADVKTVFGDVLDRENASKLLDCDYLFLAADSMRARLLFNGIVHQYLVPGAQVGAKVRVDAATGDIIDVFTVNRPVMPDYGCLWCNQLISPALLQEEAQSEEERRAQRYVDEPEIAAPSVITLNATVASQAANDFMFYMTGLTSPVADRSYLRFTPLDRTPWLDAPRKALDCPECGSGSKSRLARGDGRRLPLRQRS